MAAPQDIDYTVLLVFPGFGPERDAAETIVESAIDWLNTFKDEPGFRFAYQVSAHLEVVQDAADAHAAIAADEGLAMVLLHDLAEDERDDLLRVCEARQIGACFTVDAPRRRGRRKEPWQVVLRTRRANALPAHTLCAETLTDPIEDEEEAAGRAEEVIAVLALGVMTHHWHRNPPSYAFLSGEE